MIFKKKEPEVTAIEDPAPQEMIPEEEANTPLSQDESEVLWVLGC